MEADTFRLASAGVDGAENPMPFPLERPPARPSFALLQLTVRRHVGYIHNYYVGRQTDKGRTCFHLIGQSVATVGQQLVDVLGLVGQRQIDDFQQLFRMVEVEDLAGSVERLVQEIHQDFRHPVEEFSRLWLAVAGQRQQI